MAFGLLGGREQRGGRGDVAAVGILVVAADLVEIAHLVGREVVAFFQSSRMKRWLMNTTSRLVLPAAFSASMLGIRSSVCFWTI